MELSDAGLRALMKANGIRRSNHHRRDNYIEFLLAWLREDDKRELDLPSSVERVSRGEPASSTSPPIAPSPPIASRGAPELAPALLEIGATLRAIIDALHADHTAGRGGLHGSWPGGQKLLQRAQL